MATSAIGGGGISPNDSIADERIRQLETRLGIQEKNGRALLDELMRQQGNIRQLAQRQEGALRDERSV